MVDQPISATRSGDPRDRYRFRFTIPSWAANAVLLTLALATGPEAAAQSAPAGPETAYDTPVPPPGLTNLRYTEDYSYLRDPANRTGAWWEPFKYIPLDASGTSYLTLGAELRFREEAYWNFNWGEVPVDNYQWYRMLPYADLHLGPNVRLFGQVIGAWETGKETNVTGSTRPGSNSCRVLANSSCPWLKAPT
jgi:hypothetical protein